MEGGAIVTNDDEIYHILLTLRHMVGQDLPDKNLICKKSKDPLKKCLGLYFCFNVRPLELS